MLCRKCGKHKPVIEFPFRTTPPSGWRGPCLLCRQAAAEKAAAQITQNPPKPKQSRPKSHKDRKAYAEEYYRKNREACIARSRRYQREGGLDGCTPDGLPVRPSNPGRLPRYSP
jgi:hypothetical protein